MKIYEDDLEIVRRNPFWLKNIDNPKEEICLENLRTEPSSIY
ncbi:hypothetical protein QPD59_06540 [Clostridioides difficile]|nr:hypothetical protein [Clostridioides difficile]